MSDPDPQVVLPTRGLVLPAQAHRGIRVRGVVQGTDASAKTFELGALTVAYGSADVLPASATIEDGEAVIVFTDQAVLPTRGP